MTDIENKDPAKEPIIDTGDNADASKEDASQNNQNQDNGSDTKTETKVDTKPEPKPKSAAKEKEPAPAETVEMVKVTLVDRTAPYRRAGILFAERVTEIPKSDLTKEQIERLTKDPALKVDGI